MTYEFFVGFIDGLAAAIILFIFLTSIDNEL